MCVFVALPAASGERLYMTLPRGPLVLLSAVSHEGAMKELYPNQRLPSPQTLKTIPPPMDSTQIQKDEMATI